MFTPLRKMPLFTHLPTIIEARKRVSLNRYLVKAGIHLRPETSTHELREVVRAIRKLDSQENSLAQ